MCIQLHNLQIKCWNLLNFVTFKELQQKSALLKIAAQTFEAGHFLNNFLRFWVFEAHFLIKIFIIKKTNVYLIHPDKFEMWQALCKFPISIFSTVNFKLRHNY